MKVILGQVGGVAVSSAIFQQRLDSELRARITGPDAEEARYQLYPRHCSNILFGEYSGSRRSDIQQGSWGVCPRNCNGLLEMRTP